MLKKILFCSIIVFLSLPLHSLPATQAYLSVSKMKKRVKKAWATEVKKYQSLIIDLLKQELICNDKYHVFYHAQKCEFRIVQDFITKLYSFLHPKSDVKDFYFLRPWYDFADTIDANNFIDDYEMGVPKDWNDNKYNLSKAMLSVNFSLFGNTKNYGNFGECTFKYFFNNKSIKAPSIETLFEEIFDYFKLDKKNISLLLEIGATINTQEGSLFQIFVSIDLVDRIAFSAQRLGTPYRNSELIPNLFDPLKERYLSLTPLLNIYQNNPHQFGSTLDRLQGRLLFCQNILLNPQSGVKIFRYTTVDNENFKKYQHDLSQLTDKIFKSWLEKISKKLKKRLLLLDVNIEELQHYYLI